MAWLSQCGSTIVVLLVLIIVVGAIVRSMVKNKALSCDGCSGDCAGCGGVCPTAAIELTPEQCAQLDALELGKAGRS